ncbi:MAG: hypothetical protein WC120_04015 [Parcubacteria group bacterium]
MEDEIKTEDETNQETTGQWLQDNLRVIISILIVVAIAGGIYSYSKRTEAPTTDRQETAEEMTQEDTTTSIDSATENATTEKKTAPAASSQETENTFVETAGRGDSLTVLARRALANHLEKNPDSALTPEHKIYIEDYLRKNVSHKGGIYVGTSVEFSKSLIQDAIEKSKNLNEKQLQNLHKYAVRVPSLS